jgi:hypothetical protein
MTIKELLLELGSVEIIPETFDKSIVNYNGKPMTFAQIPDKIVYNTVKNILKTLSPQERENFKSNDTAVWDIVFKADGTVVVTDDTGKVWSQEIAKRVREKKAV